MEKVEAKILITGLEQEDFSGIRSLINKTFPQITIHTNSDYREVENLTKSINPDIIIVGFNWSPHISFQLCRTIKCDPILQEIPFIFFIPLSIKPSHRLHASKCEPDALLYSPIDSIDLTIQLKSLLKMRDLSKKKDHQKSNLPQPGKGILEENNSSRNSDPRQPKSSSSVIDEDPKQLQNNILADEKLKTYLENVPYGIFMVDGKGKYLEVNTFAENMIGYKREEIIGGHILDHILPEDYPIAEKHFQSVASKGEAVADVRMVRKDGEVRFSTVKAIKVSENLYIGFKSDITDQKIHEKKLKESQERFKTLFDYNPDAIFVWEYEDNDFTLTMVNSTANKITNNRASDFVGLKAGKIYHDMPLMRNKLMECITSQKTIEFENYYKTRYSGDYEWVFFKLVFVDPDHVIQFSETITKRKKAEQEIIVAKEKAEKREKEYTELVQSLGEGHLKADNKGYIVMANQSMAEMFGHDTYEQMIGMHMKEIYFKPADRDKMIKILKKDKVLKNYELLLKKKDGTPVWTICNIRMMIDKNGKIRGTEGLIRNINELKLAEKALRESEEKYRLIAENTSDGILILNDKNKITYASPSYMSQFGHTDIETLNQDQESLYDLINPDDRDQLIEKIVKAVEQKKKDLVYTYRFKNGKEGYIWREDHAKFNYDEDGNYQGSNIICRNVNERKVAEEELIQSEERFKNMFEYHDAPMLLIEPDTGDIINANQSAVQYYGYSKTSLCSKNIAEINMSSREQIKTERENAFNRHENYFIFPHKLSNGEIRTVEVHSSPINFKGKRVLFSIIHDVTERQKAEKEIQKSKKLLSQSEDIANMGSWEWDSENDIVYWSDGMFKIFQLSPDSGAPSLAEHSGIFTNESFDQLTKTLHECVKTGIPYKIQLQAIRSDGEIRTCIGQGRAERNRDGKITRLWGTLNDITDRKRAEAAIRDMELAKQTIKFKQNFLANMSHEIRTPLTGVLGMIEAFENTKLTKKQKDYLHTIKISGENLKEIIDQVLDYSKIEAGKVTLKPSVFEFHSVAESAKMLYQNNLKEGVSIISDIDENIPEYIKADKYRLSQIMNNLVSNAVKFTKKGKIDIRSQLLESDSKSNEVFIKVEVEDTGPGISPELHKKLFMPFSQAEEIDTVYHEGTGLGLSICSQLVKLMNGKIGLTGKSSGGSIFWFTFRAEKANNPVAQKPAVIQNGKPVRLRILLAEDKLVNQKVIKIMLNSLGHTVTIANNGQEALDHYQPGKFDLILMDIQMPVMNGVTATQKLKEEHPGLPAVIGLSANAFEGDREKYMALGMDEYLTKPVKRTDFEQLMKRFFY